MKVTVAVEIGGRTVVESVTIPEHQRMHFRGIMSDIACRLELSTYGPPNAVPEMAAEDMPRSYANPGPNFGRGNA